LQYRNLTNYNTHKMEAIAQKQMSFKIGGEQVNLVAPITFERLNKEVTRTYNKLSKQEKEINRLIKLEQAKAKEMIIERYQFQNNAEMVQTSNYTRSMIAGLTGGLIKKGLINRNKMFTTKEDILEKVLKTNNYSNSDGIEKQKIRNWLLKQIVESGILDGVMIGLPYYTCAWEKLVNTVIPNMSFIGVEFDPNTYILMRNTIYNENLPITPIKGKIEDVINTYEKDSLSHAFIDLCAMLTETTITTAKTIIDNDVVKVGGYAAFTVSVALRLQLHNCKNYSTKELFNSFDPKGTKENSPSFLTIVETFKELVKDSNYEYIVTKHYQDKGKMPMAVVLLKRIK